jgi:hypothetical protein
VDGEGAAKEQKKQKTKKNKKNTPKSMSGEED